MKAIILIGCSGSGKSTFAKEYIAERKDEYWFKIERDEIRKQILSEKKPIANTYFDNLWAHWRFKWEDEVTAMVNESIDSCAVVKMNIIVSDTNLDQQRRSLLISRLQERGYEVSTIVIGQDLTFPELVKRDLRRKDSVGSDVIAKQYKAFRAEFPLYQLKPVTSNERAIIFDIDGTLATMHERGPFDWAKVGQDKPNMILFYAMKEYYAQGYKIIIMSGRDAVCRPETTAWLDNVIKLGIMGIEYAGELLFVRYDLHMRGEGDLRSDVQVKEELFFTHVDGQYQVEAVFDDRPKVCHLWRELGFRVYACANPHIDF